MKRFFQDFVEWLLSRNFDRDLRRDRHMPQFLENWPIMLALLSSVVITVWMLFFRPVLGMADSGDFLRVIYQGGIFKISGEGAAEGYFDFFVREYGLMQWFNEYPVDYYTSHVFFIHIARLLNVLFYSRAVFDIRFLSGVFSVLYFCSLALLLKAATERLKNNLLAFIIMALGIFILNDVGYMVYFNSFFAEGVAMFTMLAAVGCLFLFSQNRGNDTALVVCIAISAFFMSTAKHQFVPIAVLFAIVFVRMYFVKKKVLHRVLCIVLSLSVLASGIVTYLLIEESYVYANQFHAMTRGVLLQAENPEVALAEFGIDPQYSLLADVVYFDRNPMVDPGSQLLIDNFYSHYSMFSVAMYYIRHPVRLMAMLEIASNRAFDLRPAFMGNFEERDGRAPGEQTNFFSAWSNIKRYHMPHGFGFILLFFAIVLAMYLPEYIKSLRERNVRKSIAFETLILIILIGFSQMLISIITAGDADLEKHVFLFNVSFDLMVIFFFAKLTELIAAFVSKRKGATS